MNDNVVELIKNQTIIYCLDGDSNEFERIGARLPYLSGSAICKLIEDHGISLSYMDHQNSRWAIMEKVLQEASNHEILDDVLTSIIVKATLVNDNCAQTKQSKIDAINLIVEYINTILMFSDVELIFNRNKIHIRSKSTIPDIDRIEEIDTIAINRMIENARTDLDDGNYDSVITKSRTVLEEVLLYVLNASSNPKQYDGNIGKMVEDLKKKLDASDAPKPIQEVITHIVGLVNNIAHIRNNYSDSHARGYVRTTLSISESRLVLNCSIMLSEYLLSIMEEGSLSCRTKNIKSSNQISSTEKNQ